MGAGPPLARRPGAPGSKAFQAKRAGPFLARHLRAQMCEDVSSETTNRRRRSNESYEDASGATAQTTRCLRGCLDLPAPRPELASTTTAPRSASCLEARALLAGRRDWGPDHLSRGIWELRVSRMSQAKRAGPPLARHLRAQICEDVSGETPNPGQRRNESCEDVSGETARTTRFL